MHDHLKVRMARLIQWNTLVLNNTQTRRVILAALVWEQHALES